LRIEAIGKQAIKVTLLKVRLALRERDNASLARPLARLGHKVRQVAVVSGPLVPRRAGIAWDAAERTEAIFCETALGTGPACATDRYAARGAKLDSHLVGRAVPAFFAAQNRHFHGGLLCAFHSPSLGDPPVAYFDNRMLQRLRNGLFLSLC
jgi:hypothetical protein